LLNNHRFHKLKIANEAGSNRMEEIGKEKKNILRFS